MVLRMKSRGDAESAGLIKKRSCAALVFSLGFAALTLIYDTDMLVITAMYIRNFWVLVGAWVNAQKSIV